MKKTDQVLIWDLPTRLFHWIFAVGFILAAVFALVPGEHSQLCPYHSILGLIIAFVVFLRVIWGFLGTRYIRFNSFVFGPRIMFDYLKGALHDGGPRYVGHNPGAAYAIFAMLTIMIGLTITGIMLGLGNEGAEELHEFLAYTMILIVVVHIMGVLLHTIRHKENIIASMIHGKKEAETHAKISSSRPIIAVIFLVLTGAWAWGLLTNYDPATLSTRLPLLGVQLQLGEIEDKDKSDQIEHDNEHYDEHDD